MRLLVTAALALAAAGAVLAMAVPAAVLDRWATGHPARAAVLAIALYLALPLALAAVLVSEAWRAIT